MESSTPPPITCKHEFVRIYQRKLKGLERRLVATKAYLPVGFKIGDFGHLGEGSYCFCTKCRTRLYPKRTAADRAQARLAAQAKLAGANAAAADADLAELDALEAPEEPENVTSTAVAVDELEVVALELEELDNKSEIEEEANEDEL